MRILIDVRLLSKGGTSGIEEYTRSIVSALFRDRRDIEYSLFYSGFSKAPLEARWRQEAAVTDWRIPNKLLDGPFRVFDYPPIERLIKTEAVFSPHFNIISTRLPQVVTFHDLSFLHHPDFFSHRQRFWHWLQAPRRSAERAQTIIAVSEFTKSDLVDAWGIPEEKIEVVYSGIHESFCELPPESPELADACRRFGLRQPFILYLGTLEPRKNIRAIIKAFSALKKIPAHRDLALVLAGQAGWLCDEIFREAGTSESKDEIIFLGRVSSEDRVYLYNLASLFVYPSFFEGFGFPTLEAQACGTPVVASNRTSLPEILGSSALLVEPWRIAELYDAMRHILENPGVGQALSRAGRENATRFSWPKAAARTADIFRRLL